MSYRLADVDDAEARIRRECPSAHINRGDYDWALSVATPDKARAYVVFCPARHEGEDDLVADLDATIEALKS